MSRIFSDSLLLLLLYFDLYLLASDLHATPSILSLWSFCLVSRVSIDPSMAINTGCGPLIKDWIETYISDGFCSHRYLFDHLA